MIKSSVEGGLVIVTWFVPTTLVKTLAHRNDEVLDLLEKFNVLSLTIDGNCIHKSPMDEQHMRYKIGSIE